MPAWVWIVVTAVVLALMLAFIFAILSVASVSDDQMDEYLRHEDDDLDHP